MASTKEVKKRIQSVQNTQKITNAMYLISSTKLRKARKKLEETRPYFTELQGEIKRIFHNVDTTKSHYFYAPEKGDALNGPKGCLVITADKGLAGAYNMNVLNMAMEMYEQDTQTRFYVVGEYGRRYFQQHHIPMEQTFLYTAQNPTMDRAREICNCMAADYDKGLTKSIFVIYTDMKNSLSTTVASDQLLPLRSAEFGPTEGERPVKSPFEFSPSTEMAIRQIVPLYLSGYVYSALVDSFCSEQNARMTAMQAANDNAEELLSDLSLQYNRVRQAAITQEITEISAGAQAQKRKKGVSAP